LLEPGKADVLVGAPGTFKPLIVAGPHLYFQKMLHLEDRFVAALRGRLEAEGPQWTENDVNDALRDVLLRPAVRGGAKVLPTPEQQAAIRVAARNAMTVISGGPGTGKTTVVVSILRVSLRLGIACEEIALAAPTGKAAHRMGEAIALGLQGIAEPAPGDRALVEGFPEPSTLHRLLGYMPASGRFVHHENNRLAERLVIVDEASMIDLALMERLVRALRDDAQFILLGDAHQIPSIDAGAVLRDLLADGEGPSPLGARAVRLTESHRMRSENEGGRNLLTVAQMIDRGEVPPLVTGAPGDGGIAARSTAGDVAFRGVEFLEAAEGSGILDQFLERWHRDVVTALDGFDDLVTRDYSLANDGFAGDDRDRLRRLFAHVDRARILCLTRALPFTGAQRINQVLHQHAQAGRPARHPDELLTGEPVMMQVNDYHRMLFNGDQGLVLNVSDGGTARPMVVFPRAEGFAAFHLEPLRPVLLRSYAMTVHKSQGSEFDQVALVLPERDLPINTREILYTALTRGRSSAVIVGNRGLLEQGIGRSIHRDSGIAEKLRTV
jgi:exodeoxyribonuclease V alpha subunit